MLLSSMILNSIYGTVKAIVVPNWNTRMVKVSSLTNRGWIHPTVGKGLFTQVTGFSMPSIKQ